ncbi:MAG: PAS domain-containing protein [Phascolarctobacterium sp.]
MNKADFCEQARQKTIELFNAYCQENDMDKALSYFSSNACFIGWGEQEIYLDKQSIVATTYERMRLPFFMELSNIETDIIQATDDYCVVLLTCNVAYHNDKGLPIHEFERASVVFHKERGEAKVVYLHSSAAKGIHDLGKILPLEHGVEATKRLRQLECDRSMAIDICEHTPNGLLYCLIGDHYPLVYANQSFCDIMGCEDFTDLMTYSQAQIECSIYVEDLPMVRQALLSHVNGTPYTINYRLVTKQGSLKWVMERGQYILDKDSGEEYYICTVIPLELDQQDFTYGNLVDYNYINNAPISVERFLQETLDYMDYNNRPAVCQKLLQHCCEALQVSGGLISSITERSQKIQPVYYFDACGEPLNHILYHFTWEEIGSFFSKDGFSICSDLTTVPESAFQGADAGQIKSAISKIIVIQGQEQYLLTLFYRHKTHNWTENEQDIVNQTAKLYSLLLDEEF